MCKALSEGAAEIIDHTASDGRGSLARDGVPLLLHAHWMGTSDFEEIIPALSRGWRVLALDQRGHGQTAHGGVHSKATYIGDIEAFLERLDIKEPIVLLGHSFGGMVANSYPRRTRAQSRHTQSEFDTFSAQRITVVKL